MKNTIFNRVTSFLGWRRSFAIGIVAVIIYVSVAFVIQTPGYGDEQKHSADMVIELEITDEGIGVTYKMSQAYYKSALVRPAPGSIEEFTGWSYVELYELGKGEHIVQRRRNGIPMQTGPNGIWQVSTSYALKKFEHTATKGMNIHISRYNADNSLLVTWFYAPPDGATSTLVRQGSDIVDWRLTGLTYDELAELGEGDHFIQRRRVGAPLEWLSNGQMKLKRSQPEK